MLDNQGLAEPSSSRDLAFPSIAREDAKMYSSRPIISLVTKVNAADAFLALRFLHPIYPE